MSNKALAPAVVTPLDDHMGLDIARSLHRRGIPVYGLDSARTPPGRFSNAVHYYRTPDPKKDLSSYLQFLVEFSRKLDSRPALFPLSDYEVLVISKQRALLEKCYEFVMPDHETMVSLGTKDGLWKVAQELGIPAPVSFLIHSQCEFDGVAEKISFPLILKPAESTAWHDARLARWLRGGVLDARAKVVLCRNPQELKDVYKVLRPPDDSLIAQEIIPGDDQRLFYISFYLNRQSQPLGIFAGRKDRVVPVGFGSASFVHSFFDAELVKAGLRVLEAVRYQGLAGLEFKKDPRDDVYKLIEVNTRFGMWDGLGAKCGVDLAYIAYCDTIGCAVVPQLSYREGIIWVDWQRDVRAAIGYRRKDLLSWRQWWNSLKGEKMWAIYSVDDPWPGVVFSLVLLWRLVERIVRKIGLAFESFHQNRHCLERDLR